jgi:hypothetical protein
MKIWETRVGEQRHLLLFINLVGVCFQAGKIAPLRLSPGMPKALAMLAGQALACMQKMHRSGVQEHFSVAKMVVLRRWNRL